jgi:hypothetical protein
MIIDQFENHSEIKSENSIMFIDDEDHANIDEFGESNSVS